MLYFVLFCLSITSISEGARHQFFFFFLVLYYFYHVIFVSLSLSFFSVNASGLLRSFCMHDVSYPVRWHVIALSTLLTALQCSISVSWFCNHRTCICLGGRIGTDTGCAGCRWVERAVSCKEPTHTSWAFWVQFFLAENVCAACARKEDSRRRIVCGHTR